ncbi:MAG TPA: hypothetical protein DCZ00_02170 [Lactococcus sp.]|nr:MULTISPECIES: CBS domain-containing protein [Lactococcus]HBC90232.1 hypothetical protein [Lactococcus sp.]
MEELIGYYIRNKEFKKLQAMLQDLPKHELKEILLHLKIDEQGSLFEALAEDKALELFKVLRISQQKNLLSTLKPPMVQSILNQLSPDDRVKLFDRLPEKQFKSFLSILSAANREETLKLQAYTPETAGRIMTTEYVTLTGELTQEEALSKVSDEARRKENIYILFVVDMQEKLQGFITLGQLLTVNPKVLIQDVMSQQPFSVKTSDDQEQVAQKVKELDLIALAVTDEEERLVGILTFTLDEIQRLKVFMRK